MSDIGVARYLQNGSPDPSFRGDGKRLVAFDEGASGASGVAVDAVGRVVLAGSVDAIDGSRFAVVRLLADGEFDAAFGEIGKAQARFAEGPSSGRAVAIDRRGRIVVAGRVDTSTGVEFALVRFLPDGQIDPSFGVNGRVRTRFQEGPGFALAISIDGQGRIVCAGFVVRFGLPNFFSPDRLFAVARYRDDGSLDPTFAGDGRTVVRFQERDVAFGVVHDARGRIVVAGESRVDRAGDAAIARLRPDGTLDVTFGVNGRAFSDLGGRGSAGRAVALDTRDRIVVAGLARNQIDAFGVARLLPLGEHDQRFADDGRTGFAFFDTDGAEAVAVDPSGRVVAVGSTGTLGEGTVFALARFREDGFTDRSFGFNGQVFTNFTEGSDDRAHAVALDVQGRIVVAGTVGHPRDWPLARGPFRAGERLIRRVPVPGQEPVRAMVYYPAIREGVDAPMAPGGPFPLVGYAHANRNIGVPACPGSPTSFGGDFRQLATIARHLARWGYVVISTDQSRQITESLKADILDASVRHMLAENARDGSPFRGRIRTNGISLLGHSTGGGAAFLVARDGAFDVAAVATLAPALNETSAAPSIGAPLLVVLGTADSSAVSGNGRALFDAAVAPKHLVLVTGANHFGYTDELCAEGDGPPTIAREDQQRIALAYVTAFLQRYVRNELSNASYLDGTRKVDLLESFGIDVESST